MNPTSKTRALILASDCGGIRARFQATTRPKNARNSSLSLPWGHSIRDIKGALCRIHHQTNTGELISANIADSSQRLAVAEIPDFNDRGGTVDVREEDFVRVNTQSTSSFYQRETGICRPVCIVFCCILRRASADSTDLAMTLGSIES